MHAVRQQLDVSVVSYNKTTHCSLAVSIRVAGKAWVAGSLLSSRRLKALQYKHAQLYALIAGLKWPVLMQAVQVCNVGSPHISITTWPKTSEQSRGMHACDNHNCSEQKLQSLSSRCLCLHSSIWPSILC